ncbi:T-complex protein 11-domain-containing protein [Copromyces sp. CBS 386.78]|nr:T-complex protein 11-domain-containing protein [Copromyces sp. CBS 386.78]
MGEQGAGGGFESHLSTHRRQDSTAEEPLPTETVPETRNPPQQAEQEDQIMQEFSRVSRELVTDGGESTASTPATETAPRLSRNSSTSSNRQSSSEYFTAHARDRRPSPLSRSSSVPIAPKPLEPPVTRATLSELDVSKIIHNPKLRHDINFDPELHFRPNLDGEKGKRKQEKANQFWNMLMEQLIQFVMDREGFYARYGTDDNWCLPALLKAAREIIETLVPQRDRDLLNDGLNVELLMQQFHRGVADLEKLAAWLSGVLKLHCAPMRDEWVDEMYNELSNGNSNNDMGELVKGMRNLLSVLEAMKLDVANHQIRCLRPVLIEDTVHFEQRFFIKKIQARKLNIAVAKQWYRNAVTAASIVYANIPSPHAQAFGETGTFFEALTHLVLPSTSTGTVPNTFLFDEERILKVRSDMYDNICLEICMRKYEDYESLSRQFSSGVPAYLSEDNGRTLSTRSSAEFNFSRPSSLTFSDRNSLSSTASSPRSSAIFTPTTGSCTPTPQDSAESRRKAQELYSSLLALLHTAPPASRPDYRWKSLAGAMALQILRFVNHPQASLAELEANLVRVLGDPTCEVFREVEAEFQQKLLGEVAVKVKEFRNLSGVGLFSRATGGKIQTPGTRAWNAGGAGDHLRTPGASKVMGIQSLGGSEPTTTSSTSNSSSNRDPREEAGVEDMATRVAHFGILHWRVWAQLAYVGDVESELESAELMAQMQAQGSAYAEQFAAAAAAANVGRI